MKKTMKWALGVALSLTLLVGFGALDVRPSWAVSTDVFDTDSKLYVPYWRVDSSIDTLLILENPNGPGAVPTIRFYDKTCKFVTDFHPPLTTDDVAFLDVGAIVSPILGEGGLIVTTAGFGSTSGAELTAETIVVNGVDGSLLRFHHINENDGSGCPSGGTNCWTTFEKNWTGAYFTSPFVDNELFLFCPGSSDPTSTKFSNLAQDLVSLAASPRGSATAFSRKVDIAFYDDEETLLVTKPVDCTCVTRTLLTSLTGLVTGKSGRIDITSAPASGGDDEDFVAFMKRQIHGTPFQVNGYMFSIR